MQSRRSAVRGALLNASLNWAVNVVRSAISASSREPTRDTTPSPLAVAMIVGRVVVARTSKCSSTWRI